MFDQPEAGPEGLRLQPEQADNEDHWQGHQLVGTGYLQRRSVHH